MTADVYTVSVQRRVRLSVSELAQAYYVIPPFNSKGKYEKLALVARSPKYAEFVFHVVLHRTCKKCTKNDKDL